MSIKKGHVAIAISVKALSALSGILITFLIAKRLSLPVLSQYEMVDRTIRIGIILLGFGMPGYILKQGGLVGKSKQLIIKLGESWRTITFLLILIGPFMCLTLFVLNVSISWGFAMVLVACLPLVAYGNVCLAAYRSCGLIYQSQVLQEVPLSFGRLIVLVFLMIGSYNLDESYLLLLILPLGIGGVLSTVYSFGQFNLRVFPKNWIPSWDYIGEFRDFSIVGLISAFSVHFQILVLGLVLEKSGLAVFSVIVRISYLPALILDVVNARIFPLIAKNWKDGNFQSIIRLAHKTMRYLIALSIFVFVFAILYSDVLLRQLGESFLDLHLVFIILLVGQLFNLSTGPVGGLLTMTGGEKLMRWISIIFFFTRIGAILLVGIHSSLVLLSSCLAVLIILENFIKMHYGFRKIRNGLSR